MSPTDIDLETRVAETLRRKSEQIPESVEPFDPTVVVLTGDVNRPSRARVLVTTAAAALLVFAAAFGLAAALRGGGGGDSSPATRPDGRPVAVVSIEALPSLTFQASEFTTAPGLNEIDFTSEGGTHSLRFADPALRDFQLSATTNQTNTGRVRLDAGRDYTVFCAMPGHRAAGMRAVIHVTSASDPPTKGTVPPSPATLADGSTDLSQIPDYVSVAGEDADIAGYVKREDLFGPRAASSRQTVYGDDLTTVVGHMVAGRGFVPVGQDPATMPELPSTTTPPTTAPGSP